MLKQRVVTAIILVGVFISALFMLPPIGFSIFIGVVLTVGAWEWADLSGLKGVFKVVYALAAASVGLLLGWLSDWSADITFFRNILLVAVGWWVFSFFWIQGYPSSAVLWGGRFARLLMGLFVLIPAWISSSYLHAQAQGAWLILMIVLIVAGADVGAYFTGRAIGKKKLAAAVSPGKSWEGVWGGVCAALIVGASFNYFLQVFEWHILIPLLIPVALISVIGDLLESMVKRHRGIKDSSQLLPGHGGILDRVDALVAAVPVFSLIHLLSVVAV